MVMLLRAFEDIVRRAHKFDERPEDDGLTAHPFDRRNIHPELPSKVRRLFDDGYYAESTFEALKYVDKIVQEFSNLNEVGVKLMMLAFAEDSPLLQITPLSNASEKDEQKGYRFLFAGAVMAFRNPRGHEINLSDDLDACLDHLAFVSLLIRRLEQSGFSVNV